MKGIVWFEWDSKRHYLYTLSHKLNKKDSGGPYDPVFKCLVLLIKNSIYLIKEIKAVLLFEIPLVIKVNSDMRKLLHIYFHIIMIIIVILSIFMLLE